MKYILTAFSFVILLAGCGNNDVQQQNSSYKTLSVTQGDRTLQTEYTATVSGKQFVEIRPQVSGTITGILINEGDQVRKGQILFIIDQVPYKAALETAVANVRTAEAKLATAKLTAESKEELCKENVVSEFDLQTARNSLLEAEANLAQAKAQEVNARNNLSYTEVKSPVDGVASMIPYRVGALVSSSITEPLVTVSDQSSVYVYFSMTENQILDMLQNYGSLQQAIEKLPEVELKMSNGNVYAHKGKIDAISGTIETSTGAISVRASFPNPEGLLRNGGSGSVMIPSVHSNCIVVPKTATYEIQNKTFVYKIENGYTKSVAVDVFGLDNGTEYIVESGIQAGDTIIAEGAGLLKDGIKIQ